MTTYVVTTSNWNDPLFWASLNETVVGHELDFSGLGPAFSVDVNQATGVITISDGVTPFTVGESGVTGTDANFGGTTLLEFFDTLIGSAGNDTLQGTSSGDSLDGGAGDDSIDGGAGNDTIQGGTGNDTLDGGLGSDTLSGGDGNDLLITGGSDTVDTPNLLQGDAGNDTLRVTGDFNGNDTLDGGTGVDTLELLPDDDRSLAVDMTTGVVADGALGSQNFVNIENVTTAGGNDDVTGDAADNRIETGAGSDTVDSGDGDDTIIGGLGADTLRGESGSDTFFVVSAAEGAGDSIFGGTNQTQDNDILDLGGAGLVTISQSADPNDQEAFSGTVTFGDGSVLTFEGIEEIRQDSTGVVDGAVTGEFMALGYTDAQVDAITEGSDTIFGNAGTDDIRAAGGDDVISGGEGNDFVFGGLGNDTIFGEEGIDNLRGEDGADSINAGTGADFISGGAGNDTLLGGDGQDDLRGDGGNDLIYGDGGASLEGGGSLNFIINGSFEDTTGLTTTGFGFQGTGSIPGWTTADGTSVIEINDGNVGGTVASDGSNWLDLEESPGNILVGQDVQNLVSGESYRLSFDVSDSQFLTDIDGPDENTVEVYWGGELVTTIDPSNTSESDFETITLDLVAGSGNGNDRLEFQGTGLEDNSGAGLDNVKLFAINPAGIPSGLDAGAGDDYIEGGTGSDTIYGGDGNDELRGGDGADSLFGGAGNDTIYDGDGSDTVFAGDGDDVLGNPAFDLSADSDQLFGEAGNDTIYIGNGADTADGGDGADFIYSVGSLFSKVVTGGEGGTDQDTLSWATESDAADNVSIVFNTGDPEAGVATIRGQTVTFSEFENIEGTQADDTFDASATGAGTGVSISAQGGDDSILGGAGDDTLQGDAGNDTIAGGSGADVLDGGSGDDVFRIEDDFGADTTDGSGTVETGGDTIDASAVTQDLTLDLSQGDAGSGESGTLDNGTSTATFTEIESVTLGSGNDSVIGSSGADSVSTGAGNDTVDGGDGADFFDLGAGDDSVIVDQGDTVLGGTGDDYFTLVDLDTTGTGNAAISITGGEGGETSGDTLQLTSDVGVDDITFSNTDDAAGGLSGSFTMADGTLVTFAEVENIICFTPGTRILTGQGERAIETLQVGDLVVTRDQGLRPIRWIGQRTVPGQGRFAPVRVGANALDHARRGLLVSQQHRILFTGYRAELLFGDPEVLVAAKHLVDGRDVVEEACAEITYIHMMFDHHEVIYAEGIATESFHAGDVGLSAVSGPAREELFSIFPELRSAPGHHLETARQCLKKHEAQLLVDDRSSDSAYA